MKILLIGEYSGLHANLANGLTDLGHQVTVASSGDGWKNYPRDIDLKWNDRWRKVSIVSKMGQNLLKLTGYDIVQFINPIYLDLKAEANLRLFEFLKKRNRFVFLGVNGSDYIYLKAAIEGKFKTTMVDNERWRNDEFVKGMISPKFLPAYIDLNMRMAESSSGITACCAEYYLAYADNYKEKLAFIPLPIKCSEFTFINTINEKGPLKFFLGMQKVRQVIKGMDVILKALQVLKKNYPDDVELIIAENVPFDTYKSMMDNSHILCDQLYSYGCGINGAMAMAKGLIVAGGGEEEMYEMFGEKELKPIVNLPDDYEDVLATLEALLGQKKQLIQQAKDSMAFAQKHHDHVKVAKQYLDFWESRMV